MASVLIHESAKGRLTWEDEAFGRLEVFEGVEWTDKDYAEFALAVAMRKVLRRWPLVIDRVHDYSASFDGLMLMKDVLHERVSALGYVTYRPSTDKVARHVAKTYEPHMPVFIFHNYADAADWARLAARER